MKNWREEEDGNFVIAKLPGYTTERYYLISELEDATDGMLSVEGNGDEVGDRAKIEDLTAEGASVRMYYMLWNCTGPKPLDTFKTKVKELLGSPPVSKGKDEATTNPPVKASQGILAIETLVNSNITSMNAWENCDDTKLMRQAMDWLVSNYSDAIGCAFFGAANDTAGTPALEALLNFLQSFRVDERSQNHDSTVLLRLPAYTIAKSKVHYLGHDTLRDPDAKSNVFQVLVSSKSSEAVGRFKNNLAKVSLKHPKPGKKYTGNPAICTSSFVNDYLDYMAVLFMIGVVLFAYWIGL